MSATERRSHAQWRELIRAQELSGETILAFCEEGDVSVPSFHYHKHKMREEGEEGFREVALSGRGCVRLVRSAEGWSVEVGPGFDPGCLRAVMQVVGYGD